MKNLVLFSIAFLLCLPAIAQVNPATETNAKMSKGVNRGWKILIPEASLKETIKAWEKLMKDYDAKTNSVKRSDDYLSENAVIPSIQDRALFIYAQFSESPDGIYLTAFFDLGGAFLNSDMHKDKVDPVQKLLQNFAKTVAIEAVDAKIKEQEKAVKKLEKDDKDLKNKQSQYEKDIKDCEEQIKQRKADLEENKKNQEKKLQEIEDQKKELEVIKSRRKKF